MEFEQALHAHRLCARSLRTSSVLLPPLVTPPCGAQGDATKMGRLPYTHIYIYDWVFSKHTLREIAPVLQASPFYILLSTRKVAEWWSYGLVKIQAHPPAPRSAPPPRLASPPLLLSSSPPLLLSSSESSPPLSPLLL